MKSLILIRHAKSSWSNPGLSDYDRPLNSRGNEDAPKMAQRLIKKKYPIDLFVASPAERAAKTAAHFASAYQYPYDDINFVPALYLASPELFYKVVESMDDRYQHIAIVSHNNGITDFANTLTPVRIDNMPTSSVFAVKIHADQWADFRTAKIEFDFFDYPKSGKD